LFDVVQVLGLWMVVVDHQVSLVISHLSSDKKNQLRQLLFRYPPYAFFVVLLRLGIRFFIASLDLTC
jgi:hypothetical protein